MKNNLDYLSNNKPPTFPDGLDVEIFKSHILKKLSRSSKNQIDKEHVTSHIRNLKKLKSDNFRNKINLSNIRVTIDEQKDLELIIKILKIMKKNFYIQVRRFRKVVLQK